MSNWGDPEYCVCALSLSRSSSLIRACRWASVPTSHAWPAPRRPPLAHTHSTSCVCEFPSRLAKAQLLSKCHRRVSVSPCCAGLPHSRFAPLCGQPVPAISASLTERCVDPPNTKKWGFPLPTPTQPHLFGPLCRGHPFAHQPGVVIWLSAMLHNLMHFQSSYRIFLFFFSAALCQHPGDLRSQFRRSARECDFYVDHLSQHKGRLHSHIFLFSSRRSPRGGEQRCMRRRCEVKDTGTHKPWEGDNSTSHT